MHNVVDLFGDPVGNDDVESGSLEQKTNWAAAEFFASGVLSELGHTVHHTPSVGYDLLLEVNGKILRTQVKGASGVRQSYVFVSFVESWNGRHEKGSPRNRRPMDRRDADLLAYVCMDLRKVIFEAVPVSWSGSKKIPRSHFEIAGIESSSLRQALQNLA